MKKIECQDCGQILTEENKPCPNCGSSRKSYRIELSETFKPQESLKLEQKDSSGFVSMMSKYRDKISGNTKRQAHETLTIDRTDANFTRKSHHVEEINEKGQTEVVHHEEKKYPAKHRSTNKKKIDS